MLTSLRWVTPALLLVLATFPPAGADGEGCVSVLTGAGGSLVQPVLHVSDAIVIGLLVGGSSGEGAVLVVEPALCHLPSPSELVGQIQRASSATPQTPDAGPILP